MDLQSFFTQKNRAPSQAPGILFGSFINKAEEHPLLQLWDEFRLGRNNNSITS